MTGCDRGEGEGMSDAYVCTGVFSEFDAITKTTAGHLKSVLILTVHGGPDENPRYDSHLCFHPSFVRK